MKDKQSLEIFAGHGSFSHEAEKHGYNCITIEASDKFSSTYTMNVLDVKPEDYPNVRILWASPPCQCFSVASIGTHWKKVGNTKIPADNETEHAMKLLEHTIYLISEIKPAFWFIENPTAMMRNIIGDVFNKYGVPYKRNSVWYCKYGDTRAKPTDIAITREHHGDPRQEHKD